jgi:NDP-sugar pyrophosphorylase family protein
VIRQIVTRVKQAFVLGAGLGKRLRPLSESLPKPLMPIFQKPLITFGLDHLIGVGVESFVINTHHLGVEFQNFFSQGAYAGKPVKVLHEPEILETGGGIKNAEQCLGREPFIVYSGDILTDIDLSQLIDEHFRSENDVTLALRNTSLASDVVMRNGRIISLMKDKNGPPGSSDYAGVSVWNAKIFERIRAGERISFIPILADWIRQNGKIGGVVLDDGNWFNIGSRTQYLKVHRAIAERNWKPDYVKWPAWPLAIAPDANVDPRARLCGFYSVGEKCKVGAGAIIENTILWAGAQIASRSDLRNCIVRSHQKAEGTLRDIDI